MSTIPILIALEREGGALRRFVPPLRGTEFEVRKLTLSEPIHEWVYADDSRLAQAKGLIRSHFGEFVRGEPIDDLNFMKRVEDARRLHDPFSHGIWSITPRFRPQYRFFGLFVIFDWFVVLSMESRDALEADSTLWRQHVDLCLKRWFELFPGREPWIKDYLVQYVSDAEKLDDRW